MYGNVYAFKPVLFCFVLFSLSVNVIGLKRKQRDKLTDVIRLTGMNRLLLFAGIRKDLLMCRVDMSYLTYSASYSLLPSSSSSSLAYIFPRLVLISIQRK